MLVIGAVLLSAGAVNGQIPVASVLQRANGSASYSFLMTQADGSGRPVRWDSCQPIDVRVNLGKAGSGELKLVLAAMERVRTATGLRLRYAGRTSFVAQREDPYGPDPETEINVALTDGAHTDYFRKPNQLGFGGAQSERVAGEDAWLFNGVVVMNWKRIKDLSGGRRGERVELYMHELAHSVGLGHTKDRRQLMYPKLVRRSDKAQWGPGDLAGLRRLGATAACR